VAAMISCGSGAGCGSVGGPGVLSYVGHGGDFIQETTYRYVGNGAGNFGVAAQRFNLCWLNLCWLLLLPLLLMFLMMGQNRTSPIVRPIVRPVIEGPTSVCRIWGDPHVLTFDNHRTDFYSQGEYWIVKSDTVYIQARYLPTQITHGLSVTKEIIISGPFISNNKLRVDARNAYWNGQPILTNFPDSWNDMASGVQATLDDQGEFLQQGREGKQLRVVHITMPNSVSLQINRWTEAYEGDYINVKITMPKQPNQDGHCGNFNGDPEDDKRLAIRARVGTTGVDPSVLLFNTKTPVVQADRPDINNCPEDRADQAKSACQAKGAQEMAACMVDVCFGGPGFAGADAAM